MLQGGQSKQDWIFIYFFLIQRGEGIEKVAKGKAGGKRRGERK